MYIISKRVRENPHKESNCKRIFNGEIKNITVTRKNVLVINSEKLFIFDLELCAEELPCYLGDVCNFCANNSGTVYYMLSNGLIRGFNYLKHEYILETSIAYLLLGN
jgi:hypothetical protein